MEYIRMRRFVTVTDLPIWVNMDNVVRIWVEPDGDRKGSVALMYPGGMVDHIKQNLEQVLRGGNA